MLKQYEACLVVCLTGDPGRVPGDCVNRISARALNRRYYIRHSPLSISLGHNLEIYVPASVCLSTHSNPSHRHSLDTIFMVLGLHQCRADLKTEQLYSIVKRLSFAKQ